MSRRHAATEDASTLAAYLCGISKLPRAFVNRIQDAHPAGVVSLGGADDAAQIGLVKPHRGLIDAARRFDPTRDVKFITYPAERARLVGENVQEIGDRLHLSRARVRQIESWAKDKLRRSEKLHSHQN